MFCVSVMWAVGIERERVEDSDDDGRATVPCGGESRGERRRSYSTRGATVPVGTVYVREAEDQWLGL
jgi:hypothetical protein